MSQSPPASATAYLPGLDTSSVQGVLSATDCQTLKARGTRFLVAKCAAGNSGKRDPECEITLANGRAAGLIVGLYDFLIGGLPPLPGEPWRDPIEQAEMHHELSKDLILPGDLVPFGDAEWPRPEAWGRPLMTVDGHPTVTQVILRSWYRAYLDRRASLLGRMIGLYFDEQFMRALGPDGTFASSPAWIASWAPYVRPIYPWAGWSAWQTSGGGSHLPNGAPVDTDVIADEATLQSLLI